MTYKNLNKWYEELRLFRPEIPCLCAVNKIDGIFFLMHEIKCVILNLMLLNEYRKCGSDPEELCISK